MLDWTSIQYKPQRWKAKKKRLLLFDGRSSAFPPIDGLVLELMRNRAVQKRGASEQRQWAIYCMSEENTVKYFDSNVSLLNTINFCVCEAESKSQSGVLEKTFFF